MIRAGIANSFLLEIVQGIHQPSDEYRMALYTSAASIDERTPAYTTEGEASGPGYAPGGARLSGRTARLDKGAAVVSFADQSWPDATLTARGALIYNLTRGNRAVAVVDFGQDYVSTNGSFDVRFPEPTADAALIRIG